MSAYCESRVPAGPYNLCSRPERHRGPHADYLGRTATYYRARAAGRPLSRTDYGIRLSRRGRRAIGLPEWTPEP